jgi:hypothetical protein
MNKPEDVVLPCGCFIKCVVVDGRNEMQISPCRMNCINLQNAIGLAEEKPVPVEYRYAP